MGHSISQEAIVGMLREVTGEVLSTMLNLEAHPAAAFTDRQAGKSDGVVSFIGVACSDWAGTGSLHCEAEVACALASRFLMSELASVDDEVMDAFGELTNMIVGGFKNLLETQLGPMALSIPTVVFGKNFSTRSPGREEWIVVPFEWENSRLDVRLCLKSRATASNSAMYGEKQEFVLGA